MCSAIWMFTVIMEDFSHQFVLTVYEYKHENKTLATVIRYKKSGNFKFTFLIVPKQRSKHNDANTHPVFTDLIDEVKLHVLSYVKLETD